ncbi:DUF2304 domain-containing protein [Ornithinimicrobium cryptoxanthini]|uniref:DUF2304 domain-containing protein n=1 Tax=Ornithinimicrobium cryptoxanthini TaxID=2934161 RepID=A0ABY4YNG0_9MICO|nr:DUF2304 domain-containing protein [Ornithinimicrobium cryptoxanthini]USQ77667.1 DUF2304 domain-containing protein [Ornithinimicrobium cryptoxanthini]
MLDQPLLDQMIIKVILLVAIVGVTVLLTRSTAGASHQAVRRLLLVGFVVLAAMAVVFPPLLTQVARAVGVGRGADLLLYGLTITFLGYVAASYRRMRQLEAQNTILARELALRSAPQERDQR